MGEQTVKCNICGAPYKVYQFYAGDQSACGSCQMQASSRRWSYTTTTTNPAPQAPEAMSVAPDARGGDGQPLYSQKEIDALKSRAEKAEKERDAARAQAKALVDLLREVPGAPRSHVGWLGLLYRIREQLAAYDIAMRKEGEGK